MNKKNLDDLLTLAKQKDSEEEIIHINDELEEDYKTEVEKFILFLSLDRGRAKVLSRIVYEGYKKCNKKPLSKIRFYREFDKFFTRHKLNDNYFYMLNHRNWEIIHKCERIENMNGEYKKIKQTE